MTLTRLFESDLLMMAMLALPLLTMAAVVASTWVIAREPVRAGHQALRPPAAARARIIALDGEAGYQARLLSPGWHFGLWRWRYQRRARSRWWSSSPARSRWSSPPTARAIPPERVLGAEVACDNFQDAEAFLRARRRARPPARVPDGGHVPHQPGAVRGRDARDNAETHGMAPRDLHVYQMPPDRVGIVTVLDGRPIPAGDLAGPTGRRARQLPARPGVHRRRRLPRPAGGGAARRARGT